MSRKLKLLLEPLEDRIVMDTYTVTRLSDIGIGRGLRGDLRYCITQANAVPGEDLIIFAKTGTINLTKALPDLTDDLIIAGPGADQLTVRRNTGGNYRIFTIYTGVDVQIYSVTIANGKAEAVNTDEECFGGGIYNDGTLTLGSSAVVGNRTDGVVCLGGGIYNGGSLHIGDSTISGNVVFGVFDSLGGGIDNRGLATIINSTISGNSAGNVGGGISNVADLFVRNSTITANTTTKTRGTAGGGGGIWGNNSVENIQNTIIAGNTSATGAGHDLRLTLETSGYNLIGASFMGHGYAPTDILDVDAMLGPLANNGGPTRTHALLPGSPAINAGDNADAPEFDQRGPGFPRIVNDTIDIGAFEVQSPPVPLRAPPFSSLDRAVLVSAPSIHAKKDDLELPRSGFRTQPRVAQRTLGDLAPVPSTPKGLDNVRPVQPLRGMHWCATDPRCAARPWAAECNPFGVEEAMLD